MSRIIREFVNYLVSTSVIDAIFWLETGIPVFRVHPNFFGVFQIKAKKVFFSDVVKYMLFKNINMHGLITLNLVCIVVFDVEQH